MSEIIRTAVSLPPAFPQQGRLPQSIEQVGRNLRLQQAEELSHHDALCQAQGRRVMPPCCKSLHISLFFDGTNNNEKRNTEVDKPPHPSNVARLYHASIEKMDRGYFRYYIPGVGTAFPEIDELDFSDAGLMYATGGEARIKWGLLRIVDALAYTLTKTRLDDDYARGLLKRQLSTPVGLDGARHLKAVFDGLFINLRRKVALHQPTLLKIKLFVYGFSRGAAEARAFMNWLTRILDTPEQAGGNVGPSLLGIPLCIEFAGLFDTVASVGVAHVAPGADGHMGWADSNQALPALVKRCYHFVSAHEQRLCFPLDSVRCTDGRYPPGTVEVVYPGVHSDVGGGYTPGDQGKALKDEELLSQITLHDMYSLAFEAGAPLAIPEDQIPPYMAERKEMLRLSPLADREFTVSSELIARFNAWRLTLGLKSDQPAAQRYEPHSDGQALEEVVASQIAWITAWRIGRYASGNYTRQPFFQAAKVYSYDEDDEQFKKSLEARNEEQKRIVKRRRQGEARLPGVPVFDPAMNQRQLAQAAKEFAEDYRSGPLTVGLRRGNTSSVQLWLDDIVGSVVYIINVDDEVAEYTRISADADQVLHRLFTFPGAGAAEDEHMTKVCALFDDQIHDSRAWFMHSSLGSREIWGGYFRYRMIYSGDSASKTMTLVDRGNQALNLLVGMALYRTEQVREKVEPAVKQGVADLAAEAIRATTQSLKDAIRARSREAIRRILPSLSVPQVNAARAGSVYVVSIEGDVMNAALSEVVAPTQDIAMLRDVQSYETVARFKQAQKDAALVWNTEPIRPGSVEV